MLWDTLTQGIRLKRLSSTYVVTTFPLCGVCSCLLMVSLGEWWVSDLVSWWALVSCGELVSFGELVSCGELVSWWTCSIWGSAWRADCSPPCAFWGLEEARWGCLILAGFVAGSQMPSEFKPSCVPGVCSSTWASLTADQAKWKWTFSERL